MVTVYRFELYAAKVDDYIAQPTKGTAEYVEQVEGRIIPGSAEEVDPADVDPEGRYTPRG